MTSITGMKLSGCAAAFAMCGAASGQMIWSGYDFSFEKPDFADFTLAQNQDRITDSVWITRGNAQGIFNIAVEPGYNSSSPAGTLWAFGRAADYQSLTFDTWVATISSQPPLMVDQDMVMHLVAEDIYIDVRFTSWTIGGGSGGGFAYVRGVPAPGAVGVLSLAGCVALRRRR